MKLLLIGGTGVISSAVTDEALRNNIEVTMINRGNRKIPNGVKLIKADKSDYNEISQFLKEKEFDAVCDFLCYTPKEIKQSFNFYKSYCKQYIFISSCAVYDTRKSAVCNEDSPKVLDMWSYSVEKWASEQLLDKISQDSDVRITVVRPCVTYGDTRVPYGITPPYGYHWTLCERILNGKPLLKWNNGENKCNMMRVEDFAVAFIGLLGNSKAFGESFNICGDETPSFNDVLDCVSQYLNKEIKTINISSEFYAKHLPSRAGEILGGRSINAINSNDKVKKLVPSFHQNIAIKDGIFKTLDAYKNNNYQKGMSYSFDGECDRIIYKWCKKNNIDMSNMNLKFIDYLGTATKRDKIIYFIERYKENLFIIVFLFIRRCISKLMRSFMLIKKHFSKNNKIFGNGINV